MDLVDDSPLPMMIEKGKVFDEDIVKSEMMDVMETNSGECPECRQYVRANLSQHIRHHDPSGRPFMCQYSCQEFYFCTSMLRAKHYAKQHRGEIEVKGLSQIKHEDRRGKCTVCDRIIFHAALKKHMATHNDRRPFQCEYDCIKVYFDSRLQRMKHYSSDHRVEHKEKRKSEGLTMLPKVTRHPAGTSYGFGVGDRTGPSSSPSMVAMSRLPSMVAMPQPPHASTVTLNPMLAYETSPQPKLTLKIKKMSPPTDAEPCATGGQCHVCGKKIKFLMERHMKMHDQTGRPFKCEYACTEMYFTTRHRRTCHYSQEHREEHAHGLGRYRTKNLTMKNYQLENGIATDDGARAVITETRFPFAAFDETSSMTPTTVETNNNGVVIDLDELKGSALAGEQLTNFSKNAVTSIIAGNHALLYQSLLTEITTLPLLAPSCDRQLLLDLFEVNRLWPQATQQETVAADKWAVVHTTMRQAIRRHPVEFEKLKVAFNESVCI